MKSTFEKALTNIIKNKSSKIVRKKPFVLLCIRVSQNFVQNMRTKKNFCPEPLQVFALCIQWESELNVRTVAPVTGRTNQ